jgi:hypothetical protein
MPDSAELARVLNEIPVTTHRGKNRKCRRCGKDLQNCKYWNHCEACHTIKFRDDESHAKALYDPLLENRAKIAFNSSDQRAKSKARYFMI